MTSDQANKFMAAVEAAGIKTYEFDSDLCTHLYHDGNHAIAKIVPELGAVVAFRANDYGGAVPRYAHNIQVVVSDYGDIHEVRTAGSCDQIKKFAETIGVSLNEDDIKILLSIDKANYDIKPETGDYVSRFHYLTQKQYNELSDDEKQKYDSEKEAYENAQKNYIGQNMAATVKLN